MQPDDPPGQSPASPSEVWKSMPGSMFVATVGGLGHAPLAPGTCGTLAALPVAWLCTDLPLTLRLGLLAATIAVGIPAATGVGTDLHDHDSSRIVVDEFVGMWATLVWFADLDWPTILVGLLAFRFFDVVKPPGARWFHETREDGVGVIGDDLAAALWATAVVVVARLAA
jgi:phosphatidylglycerophosphatase A